MLENNDDSESAGILRSGNVLFLGVARSSDKVLVASHIAKKKDDQGAHFTAVKEVLGAQGFQDKVKVGNRFRLVGEVNAFNFIADEDGRVFMVITAVHYPERLVWVLLDEMVTQFQQQFAAASLTCTAGALNGQAKKLFVTIVSKYDDPTKDKLVAIMDKTEKIKSNMSNNINKMLDNIDSAKDIEQSTQELEIAAHDFERKGYALRANEMWKRWGIIGGAGVGCLIILIIFIVLVSWPANNTITSPPTPTASPTMLPTNVAG